jgi:hypothetical protein
MRNKKPPSRVKLRTMEVCSFRSVYGKHSGHALPIFVVLGDGS